MPDDPSTRIEAGRRRHRLSRAIGLWIAAGLASGTALAAGAAPAAAARESLGPLGNALRFLGDQPFVLLFLTIALGTIVGRRKLGSFSLGSTAGALLVGIVISLAAYLGYGIKYQIPSLMTTVALNLFMFAIGLAVGPQFIAGLRRDGVRFAVLSFLVVLLNFGIIFVGARALEMPPGLATGLLSGSMTDTGVIGAATGAIEGGTFRPPPGVTGDDVLGNVAAGYAIIYLFSLVGMILLVGFLPRLSGIDARAAAREAEASLGAGEDRPPAAGADAASVMPKLGVDVRAYRVENAALVGGRALELSAKGDLPLLRLTRGGRPVDLTTDPILERGDVVTVVGDAERLVSRGTSSIGPEVADADARRVDLEVADLVVTRKSLIGRTLSEATEQVRREIFPGVAQVGRLVQPVAFLRGDEPIPIYPGTKIDRGDVLRVLGPKDRIGEIGRHVGAVVRKSTASDILTLALGMAIGHFVGYLHISVGPFSIGLGTPAGVMLAGIAISILRAHNPLFGGPVSEGARSLLQDLGLDLFITVVAVNSAAGLVGAFARGGVAGIIGVGIAAALIPPVVAWIVGLKLLRMNAAVLLGAVCGARYSTPGLRAAQDAAGSGVPAIGYGVPKAITGIIVLLTGYLALFF